MFNIFCETGTPNNGSKLAPSKLWLAGEVLGNKRRENLTCGDGCGESDTYR